MTGTPEGEVENLLYSGHGVISMLLPDDFQYSCDNKMSPDFKPV